jgi:squalene-hopene/tetraprenyl-beta-curcumene cyclase
VFARREKFVFLGKNGNNWRGELRFPSSISPGWLKTYRSVSMSSSLRCWACVALSTLIFAAVFSAPARSDDAVGKKSTVDVQKIDAAAAKGIEFLRTKGQSADGSFSSNFGPGVTGLVATGLLKNGVSPDDPMVAKALKYLETFIKDDGGIYGEGNHRNYETCAALMAFAAANKDGRYSKLLGGAEKFVRDTQWGEGLEDSDRRVGGQGYGRKKRPDLSNTQMFIDALKATGAGEDDPAIQQALKFVSQCQNFESSHNTGRYAAKNPDGGFIYTPEESEAGELPNGGLRSYASMTYAGLKSMLYAGVGPDDPRVKAAAAWAAKNYDLASNPGMGTSGLFYYYHTFAKALDAMGQDEFVEENGKKHDWRAELAAELIKPQNDDGSWTNANPRWLEGDPNLVTAYALLALEHCRPEAKK